MATATAADQRPDPGREHGDEPVLVCAGLRRAFGDRIAVDDVGFHIGAGETYGLLGPNGAGKTTTISLICGLLRRDAGTVSVAGRPVDTDSTASKSAIGFVPQDLAVYPDLTATENLRFFGRLYGLRGRDLAARVGEVLEITGLTDRAGERTDAYSGGMKRRLNIGIGLLNHPRLLVLDEPTVGVDPQSRNAILASVEALGDQGMAVLYTTHYMEEAERLCDRVAIIDEGQIKAEGTRRQLAALVGQRDRVRLTASGELAAAARACDAVDGVQDVTVSESGLELLVAEAAALLPAVLEAVIAAGATVTGVEVAEPNLESVFLHLTGKALRD
ncbi:MAG TPA: ABC transporter ATP-binding protein [Egibacteraceae bacterium]|nr:ABC transporter ATP-binding protein [Egibacteraceae bacterium]